MCFDENSIKSLKTNSSQVENVILELLESIKNFLCKII